MFRPKIIAFENDNLDVMELFADVVFVVVGMKIFSRVQMQPWFARKLRNLSQN